MFQPVAARLARNVTRSVSTGRWMQTSAKSFSSKASSEDFFPVVTLLAFSTVAFSTVAFASCETTPAGVDQDNVDDAPSLENLPEFTSEQISENNGENGSPVWMSYGGMVYDVTKFVANHPGGSEKIMQASGTVRVIMLIIQVFHYAYIKVAINLTLVLALEFSQLNHSGTFIVNTLHPTCQRN
jgi:hypothetical protein